MATPRNVRHRIERTRNKHSRAVLQSGTIVIRLARNLTRSEEREHIENLLRRMARKVREEQRKIPIDPFAPLFRGESSVTVETALGHRHTFSLVPGNRTRAERTAEGWLVSVGPALRRAALHRFLWRLLSAAELPHIEALVHEINRTTYREHVREVRLSFASSQWGSCSPRGIIMLNASLLFTTPSLLRYVIVHELAHRKVTDHSPQYWEHVAKALPQYEASRKRLAGYRIGTL